MLAVDQHGPPPTPNLTRKTKQELVDLATQLGIDSSGKRDDIKARLKTHYSLMAAAAPLSSAGAASTAGGDLTLPPSRYQRSASSLVKPLPFTPSLSRSRLRLDVNDAAPALTTTRGTREEREEEVEGHVSEENGSEESQELENPDGRIDDDSVQKGTQPPVLKAHKACGTRPWKESQSAFGYDSHSGVLRPGLLPIFTRLYKIQKELSTVRHVIYAMLLIEFLQLCHAAFPCNNPVTVGPIYFLTTGRTHVFKVPVPDFSAVRSAEIFWIPLAIWLGEFLILPSLAGMLVNFDHGRSRAISELSFCISRLLLITWKIRGFVASTSSVTSAADDDTGTAAVAVFPLDGFDPRLPVDAMVATAVVGILFSFYDGLAIR